MRKKESKKERQRTLSRVERYLFIQNQKVSASLSLPDVPNIRGRLLHFDNNFKNSFGSDLQSFKQNLFFSFLVCRRASRHKANQRKRHPKPTRDHKHDQRWSENFIVVPKKKFCSFFPVSAGTSENEVTREWHARCCLF